MQHWREDCVYSQIDLLCFSFKFAVFLKQLSIYEAEYNVSTEKTLLIFPKNMAYLSFLLIQTLNFTFR